MRLEHKSSCATMFSNGRRGGIPRCDCGAVRKAKVVRRYDQTFFTAALSEGQMSLGDGNYRRAPLRSEG
jgi:hypothetical protein